MNKGLVIAKELCGEDEVVLRFGITSKYWEFYMIAPRGDIDHMDIHACLEDTLHRLIDSGHEDDIYCVMGAVKIDMDDEEANYIDLGCIDLGYSLRGILTYVEKQ